MKPHSMFIIIILTIILATARSQLGMLLNKCPRCSMPRKMFDLIPLSWGSPPGEVCFTKCLNYCISNIVGVKFNTCVPTTHLLHYSTSTTKTTTAIPTTTAPAISLQRLSIISSTSPPLASSPQTSSSSTTISPTTSTSPTTASSTTALPTTEYKRYNNRRTHHRQFHHQLFPEMLFYGR